MTTFVRTSQHCRLDLDEIQSEDESGVGRDDELLSGLLLPAVPRPPLPLLAVAEVRRDDETQLVSLTPVNQPFLPALDETALTDDETDWFSSHRAVELLPGGVEVAGVVNSEAVPGHRPVCADHGGPQQFYPET